MSPKQDTQSPEAKRDALKKRLVDDCQHMAKFRGNHWGPDTCSLCPHDDFDWWMKCPHQRPWSDLRMLDCMIETFQEHHRDDDKGGWDHWLDVAFEYRRELVKA